jgi:hypothetical protein
LRTSLQIHYTLPQTFGESGLFNAYGSGVWFICCKLLMSSSYFLHTADELSPFLHAAKDLELFFCTLLKSLSYILLTSDELELFAGNF